MHDLIIIGAGSAGLSAAIYARRFMLKTLVIGKLIGGLVTTTHVIENWPGEKSISGTELMKKIEEHAISLDTELLRAEVKEVKKTSNGFTVSTSKENYESKALILATGTVHKKLGIPGENEYYGRGVSYCAACDAPLFKNKIVGVVGGGDSAVKEAMLLAMHAIKVYIIYRKDNLKAEPITLEALKKTKNIEVIYNTNVTEIIGESKKMTKVKTDTKKEIILDGLFIEIGLTPQNELAKTLGVSLNTKGEIIIDKFSKTNIPGILAAGDCANAPFKQAITGSAEGVIASFSAYEFIKSNT